LEATFSGSEIIASNEALAVNAMHLGLVPALFRSVDLAFSFFEVLECLG
jgi:hypothetical protein